MSIISAGNTTTTALTQTADTSGNLVFTTGGANTVALTLSNTQAATFANTVAISGSTSGSVKLAVPAVAGTNTLTLPALTANVVTTGDTGTVTKTMVSTSTSVGFGICRAWAAFSGSDGTILASYNISSVTRNSAGNYTANFTTAMPDANYATIPMFQPTVTNGGSDSFAINPTTTTVDLRHYEIGISRDGNYCCVAIFR